MTDAFKIEVNVEGMTWDDLRLMMSLGEGTADAADMLALADLFDRFVVGGAAAVPVMHTQEAVTGIIEAMGALTNRKNSPSVSTPPSGRTRKRQSNT